MDKIQGEMVHPYLPHQAEVKKTYRDINWIFFLIETFSRRNEFLPLEIDKIQGQMFHPYLLHQAELKKP